MKFTWPMFGYSGAAEGGGGGGVVKPFSRLGSELKYQFRVVKSSIMLISGPENNLVLTEIR